MNITDWKDQIKEHLTSLYFKANAQLPTSTYGAITAATLIPLVDAFATGGPGAFWALAGPVVGGVGSSLLANNMQQWADQQSAAPSAEEFAQQLATTLREDAGNNEELRAALDELNQKFESITIAAEATNPDNRDAFVQALRTELSQLGNVEHYAETINRIENSGSGSVAVGNKNIVSGEGGMSAKEINLHVGDVYHNPPPTKPASIQPDHLTTYLHALRTDCDALPLAAMGGETGLGRELCLGDVYIALDTTAQVKLTDEEKAVAEKQRGYKYEEHEEPTRIVKAQEAADQNDHLLLLGDPGSGKSTFVRQLTARNATNLLQGNAQPIPIFVVLHELISGLDALADDDAFRTARQRDQQQQLADLFADEWTRRFDEWNIADFEDEFIATARSANGNILLVLDGLDEIPERLRPLLFDAIPALENKFAGIKQIIVTCRVRSYYDGMLPGYKSFTLADFTDEQIANFVAAWYKTQQQLGRMDQRHAEYSINDLQTAAQGNLRELASTPMLLTTMTIIHQHEKKLPDQRVELYTLAVHVLMNRWQQGKDQFTNLSKELNALLANNRKLRPILERLAYEAHKTQAAANNKDDSDDKNRGRQQPLRRGDLLVLLDELLDGDSRLATEFLNYIDHRAGLLVGRGGNHDKANRNPKTYSFPHRTFQEYLAGCYMNHGRNYIRTYISHTREDDYWRVAALLGAEELFFNNANKNAVLDLAYGLCPLSEPQNTQEWRRIVWSAQVASLVGSNIIEADNHMEGGIRYLERLQKHLIGLVQSNFLDSSQRMNIVASLSEFLGGVYDTKSLFYKSMIFFDNIGFDINISGDNNSFICKIRTSDETVVPKMELPISTIHVGFHTDSSLTFNDVSQLQNVVDRVELNHSAIIVIVNKPLSNSGWGAIAALKSDGIHIIPIDASLIINAITQQKEQQIFSSQMRQFLGRRRNLYDVRDPVSDRLSFYGREQLCQRLLEIIHSSKPIALIGLRKMGKSSLLQFLTNQIEHPIAYVDLQAGTQLLELLRRILRQWAIAANSLVNSTEGKWHPPVEIDQKIENFTSSTISLLEWLHKNKQPARLGIFIDEIEIIVPKHANSSSDSSKLEQYLLFARVLRGLIQEVGDISLVVTGVDLSINRINRWQSEQNPFYQFFQEEFLGPLSQDDCRQMAQSIGHQMGIKYTDESLDYIVHASGGHPFFARQICSIAWSESQERGESPDTLLIDIGQMSQAAMQFIQHPSTSALLDDENGMWKELTDSQHRTKSQSDENRRILAELAQYESLSEEQLKSNSVSPRVYEKSVSELRSRGVISGENSKLSIQFGLFCEWIKTYMLG